MSTLKSTRHLRRNRPSRIRMLHLTIPLLALTACSISVRVPAPGPAPAPSAASATHPDEKLSTTPPPDTTAALPIRDFTAQYTALLRQYVSPQTATVDYTGLRADRAQLRSLVDALAAPRNFPRDTDRLAFLINAYNLLVLYAIVDAPLPAVTSPRSIDGFYNQRRFTVLTQSLTLDELRDTLIRPLDDPRVHAALCNGAIGSAPLLNEAYAADRLDGQLNDQCRRFVVSPAHNTQLGGTLLVSPLFEWFAKDFQGPPFHGPLGFLRTYADDHTAIAQLLKKSANPPLEFMDFNWALNAR